MHDRATFIAIHYQRHGQFQSVDQSLLRYLRLVPFPVPIPPPLSLRRADDVSISTLPVMVKTIFFISGDKVTVAFVGEEVAYCGVTIVPSPRRQFGKINACGEQTLNTDERNVQFENTTVIKCKSNFFPSEQLQTICHYLIFSRSTNATRDERKQVGGKL